MGLGAALVMYLIPFWDWIPTGVVHQYYCAKDAGFWVYKTLDQWKAENPGVAETLVANKKPAVARNAYVLNQRFDWAIKQERYFPLNYMMREEQQVVDSKTGEILARYVNYSASHERRQAEYAGWKFWLDRPYCNGGAMNKSKILHFANDSENIVIQGRKNEHDSRAVSTSTTRRSKLMKPDANNPINRHEQTRVQGAAQ